MKWLKMAATLVLAAAMVLYITKPSPDDVETYVHSVALSQLEAADLKPSAGAAANVALMGCKLDPTTCYDVFRRLIDIQYDDKLLYANVTITGLGPANHCRAILKRVYCSGADAR